MTSQWTYTITHYDESDSWSPTVLSAYEIDSVPLFTDQGSGEVNRAIIRLNAINGKFLIDSATTQPYIDQFDKIRIVATDGLGGSYDRVFEVIDVIPSEDEGQGTVCQVECLGNEWYTQHIYFAKPFWFFSAFDVGSKIGDVYNSGIGSKQPTLVYHDQPYNQTDSTDSNGTPPKMGNALPQFNVNIYDYDTVEKPCYDYFMDLIDRQAASVDAGGVLDFFELGFETDATDLHKIYMRLFSSGGDPNTSVSSSTIVTIDATGGGTTVNTNLDESEGGISAQTATRLLTWGDQGSLPRDYSKYSAGEFDFVFRPSWSSAGIPYQVDSKVRWKGKHWKCILAHTSTSARQPPTPPTTGNIWWTNITFKSEVADQFLYSYWTAGLAPIWQSMGSNYALAGGATYGQGMWDSNLVINFIDPTDSTKGFKRTWVYSNSAASGNPYFMDLGGGANSDPPKGYRWLNHPIIVNGVPVGATTITGTDPKTGYLYQGSILQYDEKGNLGVLYDPRQFLDKFQVAVLDTGQVVEWNTASQTWIDKSSDKVKNDCFHPYTSLSNVDGFQQGRLVDGEVLNFTSSDLGYRSALQIVSTYSSISALDSSANYYKAFAGFCLGFPFPMRGTGIFQTGAYHQPPFLDPRNMNWDEDFLEGFNQANSEDHGTIEAVEFEAWVSYNLADTTNKDANQLLIANIPCRVTVYDIADNVFVSDQVIPFRNNWTTLTFPINDFKPYKATVPLARSGDITTILHPKDLEPDGVFDWRNLKLMSIQLQPFFDEYGRYSPLRGLNPEEWLNPQSFYPLFGATVTFKIDGFRFRKRNLVMTPPDVIRNIEAPFGQRNDITSYNQLKKDNAAQLEIEKFRHKEFVVGTQGKFDIDFGDSFYYKNPRLVNDSDNGSNTIKLVAKKIEYSITKGKGGKGGLMRKIHGVKRFS